MKYYTPLVALMVMHVVLLLTGAYSVAHVDSAMHLVGGICLGVFVLGMLDMAVTRGWCPAPGKIISNLLVVSLVVSGAVCWEFYEWASDTFLGTYLQPSLNDTVKDLFLGLSGAVLYVLYINFANSARAPVFMMNSEASAVSSEE